MKVLGINKTKYMMDLYAEKLQHTDEGNQSDITCSPIGSLNSVKTSVLPKLICRFTTIPIKIPEVFVDINKLILKFIRKDKETRMLKQFWKSRTLVEKYHYIDKDSVVLVKGQMHRSMERNRESRNRLTQKWPIDYFTKVQWERLSFQQMILE